MSDFQQEWTTATDAQAQTPAAVVVLAEAIHSALAHWSEIYNRVRAQPANEMQEQRLARLMAIHGRLSYYLTLMNIMGELYLPTQQALYQSAIFTPDVPLPSWMSLRGAIADGFAEDRYSIAQWLDEAIARPLLYGDYNEKWAMAVDVMSTMDADDGEPLLDEPMPPPGMMGLDEWAQISQAESSTSPLPIEMATSEDEGIQPYYQFSPYTAGKKGRGNVPNWVIIAAVGVVGLFAASVILRGRGD